MELGTSILLGLVQGIAEFLPISSSGHLVLMQELLGVAQPKVLFAILLHVGTLIPVLIVFSRDLAQMGRDLGRGVAQFADTRRFPDLDRFPGLRLLMLVGLGSIPTVVIGIGLRDTFKSAFESILVVAIALSITGLLLQATRFLYSKGGAVPSNREPGPGAALLIGVAQGLAITPGISRSGSTIAVALLLGVGSVQAARFSFLLSIPAIVGAFFFELSEVGNQANGNVGVYLIGSVVSVLVGYICLKYLVALVKRGMLHRFAYYCWAVSAVVFLWVALK